MTRFLFAAAAFAPSVSFAQTCPTADVDLMDMVGEALSVGTTCQMGDDNATSCGSGGAEDVLHSWMAPADGRYIISTIGSSFDTILSVHDASCGELACDDDEDYTYTLSSVVIVDALIGDEFFVNVDSYSSCGDFTLAVMECTDGDGDGSCDELDPCFGEPDTDGDGFCDAIDYCEGDDASGDDDFDGICNDVECIGQPDTDGDGTCDEFDDCEGDDASGDDDFDGICNDSDFRLLISNNDATMETTLTIADAPANTIIRFAGSFDGGRWCRGIGEAWGPLCLSMERPHPLGNLTTDANGDGSWTFVNPEYDVERLKFQAFWQTATESDVTNLVWQRQGHFTP